MKYPQIVLAGDSAVSVEFGDEISVRVNDQVNYFQMVIEEEVKNGRLNGVVETIPAFCSLMICYDPEIIWYEELEQKLKQLLEASSGQERKQKRRLIEIPVCYGGELGPDLNEVAKHANMSPEEVVRIHSETDYLIYMLGFLPGFAYLGGLDPRIETPRLTTPRVKIPAGSVGIGGRQTGIYPLDCPGGWNLIGATPVRPFRIRRKEPILYRAGDYIRFVPVDRKEYDRIKRDLSVGLYKCSISEKEG